MKLYDWSKIKNRKELNGTQNFTFPHEASLLGQIMICFLENLSAADFKLSADIPAPWREYLVLYKYNLKKCKVKPPKFTVISTLLNLSA